MAKRPDPTRQPDPPPNPFSPPNPNAKAPFTPPDPDAQAPFTPPALDAEAPFTPPDPDAPSPFTFPEHPRVEATTLVPRRSGLYNIVAGRMTDYGQLSDGRWGVLRYETRGNPQTPVIIWQPCKVEIIEKGA